MSVTTLNSNIASLVALRRFEQSSSRLEQSLERLSSGARILRPSDDAAGRSIAALLNADAKVLQQAVRNINDGLRYLDIADGAVGELNGILARIKELSAQASNGVYSNTQRAPLEAELLAAAAEYNRIIASTEFNNRRIFSADDPTLSVQAGYGLDGRIELTLAPASTAASGLVARGSIAAYGGESNGASNNARASTDGRYVAFESSADNLVPDDTNGTVDIFVFDRFTGDTARVNVSSSGAQANALSFGASISSDGRYVSFYSDATNLVAGDANLRRDIFVHDRETGQTSLVSIDSNGVQSNQNSSGPAISGDGRYVAFTTTASNLVAGDTNGVADVFVRDLLTGQTTRVSVDSGGAQANAPNFLPQISHDGRYVAFYSQASNLVAGDTNGAQDVFIHDRITGQTSRVSVSSSGVEANATSSSVRMSSDGRYLTFQSAADNLVAGDTNGSFDVFLHDRMTGETSRVSISSTGTEANAFSATPSISNDGRFITFESDASNLIDNDTNGVRDIFVHDTHTGQTIRLSQTAGGIGADGASANPSISPGGHYVVFSSNAGNLQDGDANGLQDIYIAVNLLHAGAFAGSFSLSPAAGLSVATRENALAALTSVDFYITELGSVTAAIGSAQSRLAAALENVRSMAVNMHAAESRIVDTDLSEETSRLIRERIQQQAAAAVLAQSNQLPSVAIKLLS